jgi:aspartyl/asparaginyl beta-hydroxylase (cupin superfamily)
MSEVTDLSDAEAACDRRLQSQPDDVVALNTAALGALTRGDQPRALELLERAARLAPEDAATHFQLARARQVGGDSLAALAADANAVRLAPDSAVFRLHYALGLERHGDRERALLHFAYAIKEAQSRGQWIEAASTPPALRPSVQRAVETLRRGQQTLLHHLLAPLIARYGRSSLDRIFAAIRVYVGEQQPNHPDARQRPSFFFIPGLRPCAYFDRRLFSWIAAYEECFVDIRRELEALLPCAGGRERVFGSEPIEQENLRGYDATPSWNGYYFYRHGKRREGNCSSCPVTAAALDAASLIRVRDHGPEALFSVFGPGTHLLPHRGVTNARAVSHLPLMVPAGCALRVGGEERAWVEGRTMIFDDTYEHEAWNRSQQVRVVLIADVWNPHLTEVERAAVADVIAAIGDFQLAVDKV